MNTELLVSPPDQPVDDDVLEELRQMIELRELATRRPETALHRAADQHETKISVALRYAFARGRKAIKRGVKPDAEKVAREVRTALESVLPQTLRGVVVAGGEAAVGMLGRRLRHAELRTAKRFPKQVGPFEMSFDGRNQAVIDWADRHAAELIDGISETTREAINNAVADALEYGSLDELFDEILAAVGDEARATLIARTELMTAANAGQRLAWDQAVEEGYLTGDERRTWIATGDESVCPICEELDGTQADLDGEYPDPGGEGPPAHPRCRCTEGLTG